MMITHRRPLAGFGPLFRPIVTPTLASGYDQIHIPTQNSGDPFFNFKNAVAGPLLELGRAYLYLHLHENSMIIHVYPNLFSLINKKGLVPKHL